LRQHGFDHGQQAALGDQADGAGIVDQAGQADAGQQRRQRHRHGADPGAGPVELQQFQRIGQQGGDPLGFFHAQADQHLRDAIDPPVETAVVEALFLEHHRRGLRPVAGVAGEQG